MRILFLVLPLLFSGLYLEAQQVSHKIEFADMELKLTKEAIADIQTSVDALTRNDAYFQKKLEHVDMYMPIIERIFREEGLPDDFKYLVIQESSLISDAVSSSNAVGFWQFKEISGLENDLRIDRVVDERKNIVSSTRAAANYLKNHNKVFNNWAYSLIAYQTGVGGAKKVINERYNGEKKMPVSKNTYWYLKKFLAHKIAFENALGTSKPSYWLREVNNVQGASLDELAEKYSVDDALVKEYNKWLSARKIPEDKDYTVIIPLLEKPDYTPKSIPQRQPVNEIIPYDLSAEQNQPILIEGEIINKNAPLAHEIRVNGLEAIVAANGYSVKALAEKGALSEVKFRRFNDMSINQKLLVGEIYYLERKLNRAKYYYHTVYPDENMWSISQKYGLKLHKLYRKNRIKDPTTPKVGRVLWLRLNRPHSVAIEIKTILPTKTRTKDYEIDTINTITPKSIKSSSTSKDTLSLKDSIPLALQEERIPFITEATSKVTIIEPDEGSDSIRQKKELTAATEAQHEESAPTETSNEAYENPDSPAYTENPLPLTEYKITKGDTFFSIANRFNMRISELLSVNNLSIKEPLAIDQIILVQKGDITDKEKVNTENKAENKEAIGSRLKKHTIVAGETLYGIAKAYNVSLGDILKWNNKDDYSIKEGEIIIVQAK